MGGRKPPVYVVIWWAHQSPFYAVATDEEDATWTANLRNGVVVEIEGEGVVVRAVRDHWRRDPQGKPMPAGRKETVARNRGR